MHSQIVMHYLNGAIFPRGGSHKIAQGLVRSIEESGGRVLVKAYVEKVIVHNNKATGVRLDNGDEFHAPVVISNVGVLNTRDKLLDANTLCSMPENWRYFETVANAKCSVTMCFLFVSLEGSVDELKLPPNNIWSWPGVSETTTYTQRFAKVLTKNLHRHPDRPVTFIAFPCAKESTWNSRYPGKSNALVLTMVNFEDFAPWAHMKSSDRDADSAYQEIKALWREKLSAELFAYFPHLKNRVKGMNVGTPLSFNTYLNTTKGEVFGLQMGKWRFAPNAYDVLRPTTPIEGSFTSMILFLREFCVLGLYQSGQDIVAIGIMGSLMSSVVTAHSILKFGQLSSLATGHFDLFDDCVDKGVVRPLKTINNSLK
jgi:all-trans-retinol 13,14-reductase